MIGGVDTGQAALEQLPGLGGAPAAQAFLGERGPVLHRVGLGHPLRLFAQVARVDHRADVPHRLARGVAVAQVGQDLQNQVGEATGERQPHDDENPLARPAGPHDMGQTEQLKTEDQGGGAGMAARGKVGDRTAVSQILP